MFFRIVFLALLFFSPLMAGFENHLKEIVDKSGDHRMENIDFIYMINLDQRPEKLEQSLKQLEPYGIHPYRFSAVNGWELPLEVINDVGYHFQPGVGDGIMATWYPLDGEGKCYHEEMHVPGRSYFCHCTAKGTIGILLSHLSILQDAYESGYETIWVMEDDIEVLQDPRLVSVMIKKLDNFVGKDNWDILFTDQDIRGKKGEYISCYSHAWRPFVLGNVHRFAIRKRVGQDFRKIGARYGAHSYIIRRSGIEKILTFLKERELFLPYDMEFNLPVGMKLYSVKKDIVSNLLNAISDNGIPGYENKRKAVE